MPTPQCAPNFAFLMAADARNVVRRLPEVRDVSIKLEDHYTGEEINAALGRGDGFSGAFPGETADDDLAALRELFLRKALVGRQSRLCEMLLGTGPPPRRSRRAASRNCRPTSPTRDDVSSCAATSASPDDRGRRRSCCRAASRSPPSELGRWMRTARLVRMSLEVNGGICRSLLRYATA